MPDGSVPLLNAMPNGTIPLLIAIIALIILSAFFSATETSFSCASRIKLRSLATNGNKRAGKVVDLVDNRYNTFLSTVLVGNNIVNIALSTLATIFFASLITSSQATAGVVSTAVTTVLVLMFGEITPKFIANIYPEKIAMAFYPIIMAFYYLFYPFNLFFNGWKWLISKIFRLKNESVVTEDEILTIVEEAEEDGTIGNEETKLIRSVIEFDDLEVGDILVPRVNIAAVEITSSMEEIRKVFTKEGYSRLPVYKDGIDTIIGTIHQSDFYNAYLSDKKDINGILQNAFYTTEHVKISALLKQMQKQKNHIAVVLDEYGGTLGIVTLEDILEELVGEIWDEHDEEINYFKPIDQNNFLCDGNAPLDDFFKQCNLEDEEESFDTSTVSGWVIEVLGEIPRAGKTFEYKHLSISVLKSTVRRVLQIKTTINLPTQEEDN